MNNRSVPVIAVLPHLVYRSLPDACAWLTRVFGFIEYFRYGDPISGMQMHLGDASIMLSGPGQNTQSPAMLGFCTQTLTIIVPDVDAHYRQATREHATIWEEIHETVYGERQYGVEDLDGHRWIFSQHVRDLSPADWGATLKT